MEKYPGELRTLPVALAALVGCPEPLAKAREEEEATRAIEKARIAAETTKKREKELKKPAKQQAKAASFAEEAQEKAATAGVSVESLLSKAQGISSGLSWEKLSLQLKSVVQQPSEDSKVQVATVRSQVRARNLPTQKAVVKKSAPVKSREVPKPKAEQPESKTEVRKVFGGLFQQETIYVDND